MALIKSCLASAGVVFLGANKHYIIGADSTTGVRDYTDGTAISLSGNSFVSMLVANVDGKTQFVSDQPANYFFYNKDGSLTTKATATANVAVSVPSDAYGVCIWLTGGGAIGTYNVTIS